MARSDQAIRARLTRLEWEAQHRPRRHALRLVALAAIGYLYPLMLLLTVFGAVVALLALAPAALDAPDWRIILLYVAGVLVALTLTAAVLLTFWVKLPAPQGLEL